MLDREAGHRERITQVPILLVLGLLAALGCAQTLGRAESGDETARVAAAQSAARSSLLADHARSLTVGTHD
jgi:hypothetical protein